MKKWQLNAVNPQTKQSLSHFVSNSPWSSADLLKYVRNKATRIISKMMLLSLTIQALKNLEIVLAES
jgi:SRSO17 transposase